MRIANTRPSPYNIRTCLQQLHDLSKILHNNHILIVNLKQKFLFAFSINMKKVRDLSPDQRRKLAPLFIAQVRAADKTCLEQRKIFNTKNNSSL